MKDTIQKIYNRIKARKYREISEVEEILKPLEKDHLDVVSMRVSRVQK